MIGVPSILLGIFYGRNDVMRVVANYKSRRGRLRGSRGSRAPSGAFNFHLERSRAQTGAYWGPIDKYLLHCIRTFRAGFERIKPIQRNIFFDTVFDVVRIRFETQTFTSPDGGVVKTNRLILHCIRTFRAGFERIKYCIKGNLNGVE